MPGKNRPDSLPITLSYPTCLSMSPDSLQRAVDPTCLALQPGSLPTRSVLPDVPGDKPRQPATSNRNLNYVFDCSLDKPRHVDRKTIKHNYPLAVGLCFDLQ